jgi:predicted TPR repeat methyltransferase
MVADPEPRIDADRPDRAAVIRAAVAALQGGDGAAAEQVLAPMRDRLPHDGDILNLSGIAANLLGQLDESLRLTAAAVACDPQSGLFLANHGAALAAAGRPAEAASAFEDSLRHRPDHAPTRRNLGLALAQMGSGARALPMLYRARDLAPDDPETHIALARCLREAGSRAAAADSARAALACDPPPLIAEEARFLLADGDSLPPQAPGAYVRLLFDAYAPSFDEHLQSTLDYRTPTALAAALVAAGVAADRSHAVLDLGCGTGLSGMALAPFAHHLVGIDLSPRMLERAAATGVYARLVEGALPGCLDDEAAGSFDLAAAADVLIYFGDVAPVLRALARVLRPGGLAAMSFERATGIDGVEISDQLRFRHHPDHVAAAAAAACFAVVSTEDSVLRKERGADVVGYVVVLRRT